MSNRPPEGEPLHHDIQPESQTGSEMVPLTQASMNENEVARETQVEVFYELTDLEKQLVTSLVIANFPFDLPSYLHELRRVSILGRELYLEDPDALSPERLGLILEEISKSEVDAYAFNFFVNAFMQLNSERFQVEEKIIDLPAQFNQILEDIDVLKEQKSIVEDESLIKFENGMKFLLVQYYTMSDAFQNPGITAEEKKLAEDEAKRALRRIKEKVVAKITYLQEKFLRNQIAQMATRISRREHLRRPNDEDDEQNDE